MRSMTGYGHSLYRCDEYIIECEVKGYNSRYLDIVHNISQALSSYETLADSEIGKRAKRGRVEISLRLRVVKSRVEIVVDEGLLDSYREAFRKIADRADCAPPLLSDYLAVDGMLTPAGSGDAEAYREGVEKVLTEALDAFLEGREREGEGTRRDLERLGARFEESLGGIEARAGELEEHYRKLLSDKYEELSERKAGSPDFMTELAAILVRYSINEEVQRLRVHIEEYKRLLSSSEPVGKRLDFLCQEMQRECNTIASKSQLVEINLLVVSMKDDVENIREQIRNVE